MASGLRRIVLLLAVSSSPVFAQPDMPFFQPPLQQTTPDGYRVHVESLRSLVHSCRDDAKACKPTAIGDDDKIVAGNDSFQVRWQWLRKLVNDAGNPALADRSTLLDQASTRLDDEFASAGATQPILPSLAPARQAANSILARPEFRVVSGQSWLDRKIAEFWAWVYRVFSATSTLGHRAPWLGSVFEWTFVSLAVVVVVAWAWRTTQRERLTISLGSGIAHSSNWQKESTEWADLARTEAAANNWREAIHCLYWASIVVLESRRLWRRDYARTPREYVRLLERNSTQQLALHRLTSIFERIWYGLRPAVHEDYAQVLALFEDLRRV